MLNPKLSYVPYSLKLKEPFGTAHGTRDTTEGMIVAIVSDGIIGHGEVFMPPYYDENQRTMAGFFELVDVECLLRFDSIADSFEYLDGLAKGNTGAKAAIDIALHDFIGKQNKKPVREIYGINEAKSIYTSYTIGLDSIETMVRKAREAKEFKTLKIKLNGENDVEIISAIAAITDQELFVDANQGWTDIDEALRTSSRLVEMGVKLIEQPFPKGMWKKAKILKDNVEVPIIADEDVQGFSDIEKLSEYYDGINIKLMKCGGIYEAFRMIEEARKYGMKILLGCMTESSIGISAAFQLAGYVDWCDLDGNLLIKNDTCEGIKCIDGCLVSEGANGIGITNDLALRRLLEIEEFA